jgi:hypothetical protein
VIWYDHRERGALLGISAPNSFATDFERRIEDVDRKVKAFILDLAAECESALPLNQTQFKYDVGA